MIVLALDTALAACSVAVLDGAVVMAVRSEPLARGHQERLAPLAQAAMAEAGLPFSALDRIGCTVGPGSFTGLRVGLAFAKGLALALDRPCAGIGTLEALAGDAPGFAAAAVEARDGQVYLQAFDGGRPLMAPDLLDLSVAAARLLELGSGRAARLVGSGAERLADALPYATVDPRPAPDPVVLARLVAARPAPLAPPRPLYLRPPEARTLAERGIAPPAFAFPPPPTSP